MKKKKIVQVEVWLKERRMGESGNNGRNDD